jgi:ElaB/YqjD/DUF883 family membrane-anchored ribosome-binding protein
MMERTAESGAALANELRNVLAQTEALLAAIRADKGEALGALRERVSTAVDAARDRLAELETQAGSLARRGSVAAEVYTRENPWTVIGGAAALGLILGSLFTRSLARSGDGALT